MVSDDEGSCPQGDAPAGPNADVERRCPPAMPAQALPKSPDAQDRALASLAKALVHPTRVSIIRQFGHVDACVREPVDLLPLSQSTVAQHLKVLRAAGLIRGTIEGPKVCYCLESSA